LSFELKYWFLALCKAKNDEGFGKGPSGLNFANSNEKRECRVFEDFAKFTNRSKT